MNNLTEEQIARVFATYYRCLYGYTNENGPWRKEVWLGGNIEFHIRNLDAKLILRPLSAITDEDAVGIARMFLAWKDEHLIVRQVEGPSESYEGSLKKVVYEVQKKPGVWSGSGHWYLTEKDFAHWQVREFLIQRGYAVPLFISPGHPDNGKTAIELGLAVDATTFDRPNLTTTRETFDAACGDKKDTDEKA